MNMTTKDKIKALTDRIDELLGGEIKELKFGCVFKVFDTYRIVVEVCGDEVRNLAGGIVFTNSIENISTSDNIKVIGRPITPTDILRAWNLADFENNNDELELYKGYVSIYGYEPRIDLSKPLHEQSEETINDLYDLFFDK